MADKPSLQGISRRQFLTFAGMTLAAGALSACVAAPVAAPTGARRTRRRAVYLSPISN